MARGLPSHCPSSGPIEPARHDQAGQWGQAASTRVTKASRRERADPPMADFPPQRVACWLRAATPAPIARSLDHHPPKWRTVAAIRRRRRGTCRPSRHLRVRQGPQPQPRTTPTTSHRYPSRSHLVPDRRAWCGATGNRGHASQVLGCGSPISPEHHRATATPRHHLGRDGCAPPTGARPTRRRATPTDGQR